MAASEEFKQALRAGKLAEAFVVAMSKTPELEITTWIASPNQNQPVSSQSQPGEGLTPAPNAGRGGGHKDERFPRVTTPPPHTAPYISRLFRLTT